MFNASSIYPSSPNFKGKAHEGPFNIVVTLYNDAVPLTGQVTVIATGPLTSSDTAVEQLRTSVPCTLNGMVHVGGMNVPTTLGVPVNINLGIGPAQAYVRLDGRYDSSAGPSNTVSMNVFVVG
jgi:hypothetical protein